MQFSTFAFLACLFASANAHFRLLYPGPRGAFVADDEPKFCGGHTDVTTNRTVFPLSGGVFSIRTGHPDWTAGVIISTVSNPNNFDNFTIDGQQQLVRGFAHEDDAGSFCMPLNISAANIPGVGDGSNVTIQVVFAGGDGNLYQCADLTLSANLTSVSDFTCENATDSSGGHSGSHGTPSQTPAPAGGAAFGLSHELSAYTAVFLGLVGAIAAVL